MSVRRIKVAMASACPYQAEYHLAYLYLRRAAFGTSCIAHRARRAGRRRAPNIRRHQ